jgi:predicted dehydrogenase
MRRLKVGVVGVGHLGKSHARILASLPDIQLVGVIDTDKQRAAEVASSVGCSVLPDLDALAASVDAATIVTPTIFHHEVACKLLDRGIPLLVEKPLASNQCQAEDLVAMARKKGSILQVGHIERFNPAYEQLRQMPINPKFVECERHGTFTGRSTDIGAVMDLMIHDLDLLLDMVGSEIVAVEAIGATIFGGHEDIVNARLRFASGCIAHLTASRMSPTPKRKMRIWAPEGYAGVDFVKRRLTLVQPSEELREHGLNADTLAPTQRGQLQQQLFAKFLRLNEIDLNQGDNLTREIEHFVHCVRTKSPPLVRGEEGLAAIQLAERVLESVRHHSWENREGGPMGPDQLPVPWGSLVPLRPMQAAA